MRTRVKFCGITRVEDAAAAAQLGADAVGFVFYPAAAAAVTPADAAAIRATLPAFVDAVALFVNPAAEQVHEVITAMRPQLLQFHGSEDAAFCAQFGLPYLKSCAVTSGADITAAAEAHPHCAGLLLDAAPTEPGGQPGGTGRTFDWQHIPAQSPRPLIIAGGLTPDNVGGLVRQVRPWGVDVSSGIAEPDDRRRKNQGKMAAFMQQIHDADRR